MWEVGRLLPNAEIRRLSSLGLDLINHVEIKRVGQPNRGPTDAGKLVLVQRRAVGQD
jgi:hypothetical protein